MVYRNEPGRGGSGRDAKDSRQKFAELLRRAERNGERIRLTRNGMPFAYIVPLGDGERLKRFDEMSRQMEQGGGMGGFGPPPDMPMQGPPPNMPPPQMPPMPPPGMPVSPYDSSFPEHADEDARQVAIVTFKKTIERIISESDPITRSEMSRRIRHDGYIATAVKKIVGEG